LKTCNGRPIADLMRAYQATIEGWSPERKLDYIRSLSGTHFDPKAVKPFFRVLGQRAETI
jgi:HD-GYP domain-containing protein (c-di-GMP phosphodiesterase class II)